MAKNRPNQVLEADFQFPVEGVEEMRAYTRQRTTTSVDEMNVRTFDPGTDRARGGARGGLVDYLDDPVHAEGVPVQNICHLVTNDAAVPAATYGSFTYGRAAGDHYGVGGSSGSSTWTAGATASYAFACSCWDDSGNVYVAEVNTGNGGVEITKRSATSSTNQWSSVITSISVNTGSLRNLAGMAYCDGNLYVCVKRTVGSRTNIIHKINATTGAVTVNWYANTDNAKFVFSTGSVNCIAACGKLLGIDCVATGTSQSFFILDTTKTNYKSAAVVTAYGGTAANNRSKVVSDGIAFFYVLASVTASIVKKIGIGGVIEWGSTVMDATGVQSIAYDQYLGHLVAVRTTTPSLVKLSLTAGTSLTTADPGTVTSWNDVDSDGHGSWYLWRNANASNDIIKVNSTYTTTWGPTTFANTTHSGCSVYKGKLTETPVAGAAQIRLLAVSGGSLYRENDTAGYSLVSGGAAFSPGAKQIFSAQHGQDMYFVDGASYMKYTSTTDALGAWAATAGAMPTDSKSTKARLIGNWVNRICLSGLVYDPLLVYLSAQDSATDFDDQPEVVTATQAFIVNARDVVNTIVPYSDDVLIIGCDHTIVQFTGDPGVGGQIYDLSSSLGMAWGKTWAIDDKQQLFFYGSRGGIYKMQPGSTPILVSQQIKRRLSGIDPSLHTISLAWDVENQGLGVWITPHNDIRDGINFFWEERTNAWHPDWYANKSHCPTYVHLYDGFEATDRNIMLGGRDGHIRILSETATDDDGTPIESYVVLGPIQTAYLDEVMLFDMQATLAEDSSNVRYDVYVGNSPEAALATMWQDNGNAVDGLKNGTWVSGRNYVSDVRRAGRAIFVKISSTEPWALERLRVRYSHLGMVRRRGL